MVSVYVKRALSVLRIVSVVLKCRMKYILGVSHRKPFMIRGCTLLLVLMFLNAIKSSALRVRITAIGTELLAKIMIKDNIIIYMELYRLIVIHQ